MESQHYSPAADGDFTTDVMEAAVYDATHHFAEAESEGWLTARESYLVCTGQMPRSFVEASHVALAANVASYVRGLEPSTAEVALLPAATNPESGEICRELNDHLSPAGAYITRLICAVGNVDSPAIRGHLAAADETFLRTDAASALMTFALAVHQAGSLPKRGLRGCGIPDHDGWMAVVVTSREDEPDVIPW